MLANLLATALIAPSATPTAACSVRFYYSAGDRRTSYHQIYLCDLRGKRFRQLTFDRSEKLDIFWLDANTVGWRQSLGVTKDETWVGYHVPTKSRTQIVTLNLKTRKRAYLHKGFLERADDYNYPWLALSRNKPLFMEYRTLEGPERNPIRIWRARHGRLISSTEVELPPEPTIDQGETFPNPFVPLGLKCTFKAGNSSRKPNKFGSYESSGQTGVLTLNGKEYVWPEADLRQAWKSADGRKLYAENQFHSGSAGVFGWIFEMDLKTAKWRVTADSVTDFEFDPNKRFWVGLGNHKETTQLGPISVWTRRLVAGDRIRGTQWNLTSRPIAADSISIRPN